MDFDINTQFKIFDEFLAKRTDVIPDTLKNDLQRYYLPYVQKLLEKRRIKGSHEAVIVGVSAIQGTGKTTQGEVLEILLKHLGYSSISRSIDDHYVTHKQLCEIRTQDPRFIRRGVTHDIDLAIRDLKSLQQMSDGKPIIVSGYDKGVHHGDGERLAWVNPHLDLVIKASVVEEELMVNKEPLRVNALKISQVSWKDQSVALPDHMGSDIPVLEHYLPAPLLEFLKNQTGEISITTPTDKVVFSGNGMIEVEAKELPNGWRLVTHKPDFIFYDGWMLGARSVEDESVFNQNLPAIEMESAREFAKLVNRKLRDYDPLWNMIEFLTVLYVPNFQDSLLWRDHAEDVLRAKGEGMSHDEIREFVYYFWRSVHPGIHIKNLAHDTVHTNQVVVINDDHTVREVLTPEEVRQKYP
jgi:pantothenate kinase-related protein Tda10